MEIIHASWGKFDRENGDYHALAHHMADVAACFLGLVKQPVWRNRLELAAAMPLDRQQMERLAVLVFLHDIGKLCPGFQCKGWSDEQVGALGRKRCHGAIGHPQMGAELFCVHDRRKMTGQIFHAIAGDKILAWSDSDVVTNLLLASFAHHGRPVTCRTEAAIIEMSWQSLGAYDPAPHAFELGRLMKKWFPLAFEAREGELPERAQFQHLFAGLVALADWIGSDRDFFPFVGMLDEDYFAKARNRASKALVAIGLDMCEQRRQYEKSSFSDLTGFRFPNPQQKDIGNVSVNEQLVILEAETGSGKTEAALWRFVKLYEAGKVDGLYFAVPTRTAAVQLHRRVHQAARRIFGEQAPETVLAVPGYFVAGEHEGRPLPDWRVLWDDDGRLTSEQLARLWAAEHSKRYLAAQIAVGTIDQAMLAALPVKHAHLRASALARSLLVIDEVHASDQYMTKIQQSLVQDHIQAGGYVLAMSATLGSCVRSEWLGPFSSKPKPEQAVKAGYPAIWVKGQQKPILPETAKDKSDKRVVMSLLETMEPQIVAQKAVAAGRAGARLLVMRNTVDGAMETFRAVGELLEEHERHLLFSVEGVNTLHHGRFAAEDRKRLDKRVEELFGQKGRRPEHGMILIGTQTLEQSLDICADYLMTDLCPVDVLLQRIGRLHRHHGNVRPRGFEHPQCLVLLPEEGLASCLGKMINGLGGWISHDGCLSGIYPDVAGLELTRRLIEAHSVWSIPAMNRELVEGGTHPELTQKLVDELGGEWADYHQTLESEHMADGMFARLLTLDRKEDFGRLAFPNDEKVRTRLGEDGFTIKLAEAMIGPFGRPITKIVLPAHWSRGIEPEAVPVVHRRENASLSFDISKNIFYYSSLGVVRETV